MATTSPTAPGEPEGAAAPPAPAATPPPSSGAHLETTTPPRTPGPRWWMVVAAVAVGIVVVLAVLLLPGSGPGSLAGTGVPFSRAEAASLASVTGQAGGSWTTLGALGLEERTASDLSPSNVTALFGKNCTADPWNGAPPPATVPVPTYAGSFGSGLAPLWLVFVDDAETGSLVMVEVDNGTAVPLALVGGSGCAAAAAADHPLPASTVDSPTVAKTVWLADGEDWVAGDPHLTSVTLAAFGGGTYYGVAYSAVWAVIYSPCNPLLGGSTQEPMFVAALSLTTGAQSLAVEYHLDCPS